MHIKQAGSRRPGFVIFIVILADFCDKDSLYGGNDQKKWRLFILNKVRAGVIWRFGTQFAKL
jgi:hypothetical protein